MAARARVAMARVVRREEEVMEVVAMTVVVRGAVAGAVMRKEMEAARMTVATEAGPVTVGETVAVGMVMVAIEVAAMAAVAREGVMREEWVMEVTAKETEVGALESMTSEVEEMAAAARRAAERGATVAAAVTGVEVAAVVTTGTAAGKREAARVEEVAATVRGRAAVRPEV